MRIPVTARGMTSDIHNTAAIAKIPSITTPSRERPSGLGRIRETSTISNEREKYTSCLICKLLLFTSYSNFNEHIILSFYAGWDRHVYKQIVIICRHSPHVNNT